MGSHLRVALGWFPGLLGIQCGWPNGLGSLPFAGEAYEIEKTMFIYLPLVFKNN
jgi:hypothetical protein